MSRIGTFTQTKDGGWSGTIHTLTIERKVRLVPNDNRGTERAPAFRVLAGHSEIGAAWRERSSGDPPKEYLSLLLDDPSLPEPISAAMFLDDPGKEGRLVWSRRASA
jgi:uncharacterized protein (DUF736 family)